MNETAESVGARAAEMRHAFDRSFAEPLRLGTDVSEDLLAIRVGMQPYAMRVGEIAGLFVDRKVTPVPGADAALIGIARFRGVIVPVYALHALLGHSAARQQRWLAIAAAAPIALAFEAFDAQLSVPPDAILPAQSAGEARSCVREFVRTPNFSGPVMHLPLVLDAIRSWRGKAVPKEEG